MYNFLEFITDFMFDAERVTRSPTAGRYCVITEC